MKITTLFNLNYKLKCFNRNLIILQVKIFYFHQLMKYKLIVSLVQFQMQSLKLLFQLIRIKMKVKINLIELINKPKYFKIFKSSLESNL